VKNFKITDGITHIPLELPWQSPGFVNVYLIEDSDGYVMIDCGVYGEKYFTLLKKHLEEEKIKLNDIKLLIGTHMHTDHIGLSPTLRNQGIPFALYKNSIDFLKEYNDWTFRFKALITYSEKEGAPKSFLSDLKSVSTPSYAGKVEKPDVLLDEGKIKNIKRELSVIFTPGHDQSEISIHDTKSKVIFSGDHILPRITPFIPTVDSESNLLDDFIISLKKIEKIEHETIAPGHGKIIQEPHKRIQQMILHHERRSQKIVNLLENNKLTGWEITNLLFPRKLDALNLRLAFQETLAHLKYLENKNILKHNISKYNSWEVIKKP
tara:strand:+ start:4026 stop:4991 length:966 start_codon:yes stop_codon:yes gene_type:complete